VSWAPWATESVLDEEFLRAKGNGSSGAGAK